MTDNHYRTPDKCNACSGPLKNRFQKVSDPQTRETFAILQCSICGLGHTSPLPDDLGRYYAYPYYGNRHSFTLRHCINRRLSYAEKALPAKKEVRLLDIGCGDGSFLLASRNRGWQVMGTELNPLPARKQGLDVKGSIEEIDGREQFDCITMWHTLEHMRDIPAMLSEVARLLSPEGKLIIAVPDSGGIQARLFGERWLHIDVPRHLYHFDASSLQHCLAAAGFAIERSWHHEFEYDLLGWSQSALNYLMPTHQNLFFNCLTGKRVGAAAATKGVALVAGWLLTLLALPFIAVETLLKRGGSLIYVARHAPPGASR